MICTMCHQLTSGCTAEEMDAAGLGGHYADHGIGIYPTDATGNPFCVTIFASKGDVLADLSEDMAAEDTN